MSSSVAKQLCLVVGTPRGFTRSVLEALLKRGSKVVIACSNETVGAEEQRRLSGLYGSYQIHYSPCDHTDERQVESVILKYLENHREINTIVHTSANDPLKVDRQDITGNISAVNKKLDRSLIKHDVDGLKRVSELANKYMGKHQGWRGGTLVNISSSTEVTNGMDIPRRLGECTVLGTTRAMGLESVVSRTGVKVVNIYHPSVDFADTSWRSTQITDDQHSPYCGDNSKYSCYLREYTGYMALHIADTGPAGSGWMFNEEFRLRQVEAGDMKTCCGIANKMCYWLGCPMVSVSPDQENQDRVKIRSSVTSASSGPSQGEGGNYLITEESLDR